MKKNIINILLIQNYMIDNNFSKTQFCKLCKIPYSALKKMFEADYNFDVRYIFRIAKVLNIEVVKMFV